MKFELGKRYLNRCGDIVIVIEINNDSRYYPIKVWNSQKQFVSDVTLKGQYSINLDENYFDIVSEYIEPRSLESIIYLTVDKETNKLYFSFSKPNGKYYSTIGKKTITITEGDNLDSTL
jgi:hypothetical protein